MDYTFKLRHHWWFNAGLAGLYLIATKDEVRADRERYGVEVIQGPSGLTLQAKNIDNIRSFLETCYINITDLYWNISNANQKEKQELVIYNQDKEQLELGPKRMPIPPIQKVIGARSWKGEGENYADLSEDLKTKVDQFLKETGKSLWGKDQKLLYGPPVCHDTAIIILPEEQKRKKKAICCVCGQEHGETLEIAQPIYLLFASNSASRSFHSEGQKPDLVCWECNFISKFAYEAIHYKVDDKAMMIISPNSSHYTHLLKLQEKLGSHSNLRAFDDQYFMKNIGINKEELLYYAKKPYELLWAFFYDGYQLLKEQSNAQSIEDLDIFMQELLGEVLQVPTEIVLMALLDKGQTFLTQDLIIYQDTGYIFRLFASLEKSGVHLKQIFDDLYDPQQTKNENKTLVRNQVLKKILQKYSILREMETFCFRKATDQNGYIRMKNMILFIKEYQLMMRGDSMTREQIDAAVNLGKQIVLQARDQLGEEAMRKVRGDLYKLRKTRTATDFLNQLNTLQLRYGIAVSRPIQEGLISEVDFEDFRAYCMLGALNVYNTTRKMNKGEMENEER